MDYYKLFRLKKEPFSNTPDPDFFFRSTRHAECLQKLEIAIRLRRGLCIVRGEVGTGKTTLCRQLVRLLSEDEKISVHMILDPGFDQTRNFAAAVSAMLCGRQNALSCTTTAEHKEMIKQHLFEAGVDQGKTTVLIIDEGQKLPAGCMEFLRELLNYETNQEKLLQIIIFAQNEIEDLLLAHPNFTDRAALYHHLQPLSRKETARLIQYRLQTARGSDKTPAGPVFTRRGISRIHRLSRGYPRKIVHLGHNILLLLLVRGQSQVTSGIVKQAGASLPRVPKPPARQRPRWQWTAGITLAAALAGVILMGAYARWPKDIGSGQKTRAVVQESHQPEKDQAAAKQPIRTAKAEPAASNRPASLGWVRINEDDRLWNMIERIYGKGQPDIIQAVEGANPWLSNPDHIRPGQKIRFPAIDPRPVPRTKQFWIAWQTSNDLNAIYQYVLTGKARDLRILSFWHPSAGLQHAAVEKNAYEKPELARQALHDQAAPADGRAQILDLNKDGIKLFGWHPKS